MARCRIPPEYSCGVHAGTLARFGDADELERVDGLGHRSLLGDVPVDPGHLGDLATHGVHGVQGGQRVLEDHRDLAATDGPHRLIIEAQEILALPFGDAGLDPQGGQEPHDRQRRHRLARSGFADHREDLAAADVEADIVDGAHGSGVGLEHGSEVSNR